jgi:hypothetical protein
MKIRFISDRFSFLQETPSDWVAVSQILSETLKSLLLVSCLSLQCEGDHNGTCSALAVLPGRAKTLHSRVSLCPVNPLMGLQLSPEDFIAPCTMQDLAYQWD